MGLIETAANWLREALGGDPQPTEPQTKIKFPEQPQTPPPISTQGKITSYNYIGDKYGDTLSNEKNLGAWGNQLTESSLAVSPEVEQQFIKAGIKPLEPVELTLADGTTVIRTWDDKTMQDKQAIKKFGKPLRGRFDFNMARGSGKHEKDDMAVIGFKKAPTPTLRKKTILDQLNPIEVAKYLPQKQKSPLFVND